MRSIPAAFIEKMDDLLGQESRAFFDAVQDQTPDRGLRVNTLKVPVDELMSLLEIKMESIPWTDIGFLVEDQDLGKHPLHAAGLYYLQEPSAMAVSEIVNPQKGEWILDLAAAPGGKTTHLASLMEHTGVLVANDPHGGRVQALARNLERWGTRKTIITQETPQRLADHFGAVFDRVLVDAPCSGEGTFRSDPGAVKHWSRNRIEQYTHQQDEILWFAAQLVKPGGVLVYATCTFSPPENEGTIARFLKARPDFQIKVIPRKKGFSKGHPEWVNGPAHLEKSVRIWPHKSPGEGHFIACLQSNEQHQGEQGVKHFTPQLADRDRQTYRSFVQGTLYPEHMPEFTRPESGQLTRRGDRLYSIPPGNLRLNGLRVQHWGWWLGTYQGRKFQPAHALAMGLPPQAFQNTVRFTADDSRALRYLRGVPLNAPGKNGWLAVKINQYPLGWGKRDGDRVQSHSPRWLSHI